MTVHSVIVACITFTHCIRAPPPATFTGSGHVGLAVVPRLAGLVVVGLLVGCVVWVVVGDILVCVGRRGVGSVIERKCRDVCS